MLGTYISVAYTLLSYLLQSIVQAGTAVAQWLRCCSTNRKVAGSIPDGVSGIFHWHNPSDCTMALEATKPLIEMSTEGYLLELNEAGAWDWQPYHHPVPLSWNLGTLTSLKPLGHSRPVTGLLYPFSVQALFDGAWGRLWTICGESLSESRLKAEIILVFIRLLISAHTCAVLPLPLSKTTIVIHANLMLYLLWNTKKNLRNARNTRP
jgi:hypothetical protein